MFLGLWTPFFIFVAERDYPLPLTSLLYSVAGCLLAAALLSVLCGRRRGIAQAVLLTLVVGLALDTQFDWFEDAVIYAAFVGLCALFWVLRRHVATILSAMFGAALLSTLVIADLQPYQEVRESGNPEAANAAAEGAGGILIHLVLDEHTGLSGIPQDIPGGRPLRESLGAFYASNGFRIYGNAISEYEATRNSVSGILNFTAGPTPYDRYEGRRPYVLRQNRYFDALAEAGYAIHVYQTTYMDYCRSSPRLVSQCLTFRNNGTNWIKTADLDPLDKLNAMLGLYLQLSDDIVERALKLYVRAALRLRRLGLALPEIPKWDQGPAPVNAAHTLDRIIDDVATGPTGTAYFAHLILPHGPYVFRRDCRLRRNVNGWLNHRPPFRLESDEGERRRSFIDYFEQLQCLQSKLGEMFERLRAAGRFEAATIILHGDHGSRIYSVAARANNVDRLGRRDYLAGFSTLFAAKGPAVSPGIDRRTAPISHLLAEAIGRPDLVQDPQGPLRIYLEGEDDYIPWLPVPWPGPE